jgi:hypothetical protein
MAILSTSVAAPHQRRLVRLVAASISALTAVLYLLIGFGVLQVVETSSPDAPSGGAYLVGALLLISLDRRSLWVAGACLQVAVIVMYVVVGQQRTPSFEVWGLTIKAAQLVLLGALLYLAIRPVEGVDTEA